MVSVVRRSSAVKGYAFRFPKCTSNGQEQGSEEDLKSRSVSLFQDSAEERKRAGGGGSKEEGNQGTTGPSIVVEPQKVVQQFRVA